MIKLMHQYAPLLVGNLSPMSTLFFVEPLHLTSTPAPEVGFREWLGAGKDIVLAIAAIWGIWITSQGLSTWKRQLRGTAEYELARRLMKLTYQWRDALDAVRDPAVWSFEMPEPPADSPAQRSEAHRRFYGTEQAYIARWQKVSAIHADFHTARLEARVLWGDPIADAFNAILKQERTLMNALRQHLEGQNPDVPDEGKQYLFTGATERGRVIFATRDESDGFHAELAQAVKGYFKSGVGNAAYEACGLKVEKSSLPAIRNSTVRMVLKLAYPRALRLAA
jgi:hypothetical protein